MEIESVGIIIMNPKQKDEREREKGDAGRCTKQSSKRTDAKKRKYHGKLAKLDRSIKNVRREKVS